MSTSIPSAPSATSVQAPMALALAEAALQRQSTLLGAKGLAGAPAPVLTGVAGQLVASWPTAPAAANAASAALLPLPLPAQAEQTHISAQAREALGAGFDPRAAALLSAGARAGAPLPAGAGLPAPASASAGAGAPVGAGLAGAQQALALAPAWPASGLAAPLRQMVQNLVQQLTAPVGQQRVVAAQVWPLTLAHALESGNNDSDGGGENGPLQTWLVRQGTVHTAEGPRGLALTLRVPAPWLASLALPASPASQAGGAAGAAAGGLQAAYTGAPQSLQSGVLALVLQGMGAAAGRTSALLVLDFQPQLMAAGAAIYGRDLLQARHDPWVQQAQLQASGQLAKEEEIARQREREAGMCQASGCPYALRAPCAQPFCLEMRVGTPLAGPMAALDVIAGRAGTTGSVTRL